MRDSVKTEGTLRALLLSVTRVSHRGQGGVVATQVHEKVVVGEAAKNNEVFGDTSKNNGSIHTGRGTQQSG